MPFDLELVDIGGDAALEAAYRELLPVIEIDGVRAFTYFVTVDALLERLGGRRFTRARRRTPGRQYVTTCHKRSRRRGRCRVAERLTVGVAARLSRYLQVLTQAKKMGKDRISSQEISEYTNINATQIRRDLSGFGRFGKRGVGYNIDSLLGEIRKILRTQGQHNIALVGAGRLGARDRELADLRRARHHDRRGLRQRPRQGRARRSAASPSARSRRSTSSSASATSSSASSPCRRTPRRAAADALVGAGVKIIFNYSQALLTTPADVQVHTSNPAVELLYALYFHLT